MATAKKKQTKQTAGKKTVKKGAAATKAPPKDAAKKKPPALKAVVRVTKKDSLESALVAACPPQSPKAISEEEIRHRAYLRWEAAGSPPGDGACFWVAAQQELLQQS